MAKNIIKFRMKGENMKTKSLRSNCDQIILSIHLLYCFEASTNFSNSFFKKIGPIPILRPRKIVSSAMELRCSTF